MIRDIEAKQAKELVLDDLKMPIQEVGAFEKQADAKEHEDKSRLQLKKERKLQRALAKEDIGGALIETPLEAQTALPVERVWPTGFKELDSALGGGLREGLFIIDAVPSQAKTAFALQIADNLAKQGRSAAYFSLENYEYELNAKSLSRATFMLSLKDSEDAGLAKTAEELLNGYGLFEEKETEFYHRAARDYASYAGHLYIYECHGDFGIPQLKSAMKEHSLEHGAAPAAIIDNLQGMVSPSGEAGREKNEKLAIELSQMAKDNKIPIIAVISGLGDDVLRCDALVRIRILEEALPRWGEALPGRGEANGKGLGSRLMEIEVVRKRSGIDGSRVILHFYQDYNCFGVREPEMV
ncbi:MAG: hypothetical protein LBU32_15725 [Clostridiales bacterium]|jgi:replicative DNA helicase|nr:hypothetical protein [Clostridiales bacterium]